jgi:hypothetical protein
MQVALFVGKSKDVCEQGRQQTAHDNRGSSRRLGEEQQQQQHHQHQQRLCFSGLSWQRGAHNPLRDLPIGYRRGESPSSLLPRLGFSRERVPSLRLSLILAPCHPGRSSLLSASLITSNACSSPPYSHGPPGSCCSGKAGFYASEPFPILRSLAVSL